MKLQDMLTKRNTEKFQENKSLNIDQYLKFFRAASAQLGTDPFHISNGSFYDWLAVADPEAHKAVLAALERQGITGKDAVRSFNTAVQKAAMIEGNEKLGILAATFLASSSIVSKLRSQGWTDEQIVYYGGVPAEQLPTLVAK